MADATLKEIPLSEVAKHSTESDCWVAIHGRVYDITKFLSDHPGGPETIVEVAGRNCTEQFEDTGHSKSARDMMKRYLIGKLPEGEDGAAAGDKKKAEEANKKAGAAPGAIGAEASDAAHGGSLWAYLIPIAILAGAIYMQFLAPKKGAAQQEGK